MRINSNHCENGAKCLFCDSQASATWQGQNGTVNVCQNCATDVLPRLIADAIWLPCTIDRWPVDIFRRGLEQSHTAFWEACASRLALMHRDAVKQLDKQGGVDAR